MSEKDRGAGTALMNISMIGIDFHTAGIEQREQYALTRDKAVRLGTHFVQERMAEGCVVLATCNRTEVWFSGLKGSPGEVFFKAVCEDGKNASLFRERYGREAIRYLMELGCGIHSQIFGEDQILAQIKQAMTMAREKNYADSVLETLFRQAVTAAKKVKSSVRLTDRSQSIPRGAMELLRRQIPELQEKRALVIGNGEMGRMMAELMAAQGMDVTMTLRQYKTFDAVIPEGVKVILYDERYAYLEEMDIVVSATLSPHYTIQKERVKESEKTRVFMDLAVPRDIDPAISNCRNVILYDMDRLGITPRCDSGRLAVAEAIMDVCMEEFERWYVCRERMPDIRFVGERVAELTEAKLTRIYQAIPLYGEEEIKLRKNVQKAVEKSVMRLLFAMREKMEEKEYQVCLEAIRKSAEEFTIV